MEKTDLGVCNKGFRAGGIRGIGGGKYGMAAIVSERETTCSAMFTANRVRAAPLLVSMENLARGRIYGIVANSGNANAYTGREGLEDARRMAAIAAGELGLKPENLLIASTGVIGRRLDMGIVEEGVRALPAALGTDSGASLRAAEAIMTTDRSPKAASVRVELEDGTEVGVGGIAKGAGMIGPDLRHATMLAFLTTDAVVPKADIDALLAEAVEESFNMTLVDGDTSTNDMVVLLANGAAGNKETGGLEEGLEHVTRELARMIARNGEGATKLLVIRVEGAKSRGDARKAARTIGRSSLVKTAFFGGDPNWGRIVAAAGYSGAEFDPERLSLSLRSGGREAVLVEKGKVLAFQGTRELVAAEEVIKGEEVEVVLDLRQGGERATAYSCDMGYEYIRVNAEYTT